MIVNLQRRDGLTPTAQLDAIWRLAEREGSTNRKFPASRAAKSLCIPGTRYFGFAKVGLGRILGRSGRIFRPDGLTVA